MAMLRAGLHYGEEEVHQLRILGEWSNMIGYEMGSSTPRGLHYNMVVNTLTFFCLGSSSEMKFLRQPQTFGQGTWPPKNSNSRFFFCSVIIHPPPPILSAKPIGTSHKHSLNWSLRRFHARVHDHWKSQIGWFYWSRKCFWTKGLNTKV